MVLGTLDRKRPPRIDGGHGRVHAGGHDRAHDGGHDRAHAGGHNVGGREAGEELRRAAASGPPPPPAGIWRGI